MEPSDINAIAFPISIKGIVFINNKIIFKDMSSGTYFLKERKLK